MARLLVVDGPQYPEPEEHLWSPETKPALIKTFDLDDDDVDYLEGGNTLFQRQYRDRALSIEETE